MASQASETQAYRDFRGPSRDSKRFRDWRATWCNGVRSADAINQSIASGGDMGGKAWECPRPVKRFSHRRPSRRRAANIVRGRSNRDEPHHRIQRTIAARRDALQASSEQDDTNAWQDVDKGCAETSHDTEPFQAVPLSAYLALGKLESLAADYTVVLNQSRVVPEKRAALALRRGMRGQGSLESDGFVIV